MSRAYYNDNDPFVCDWIENLIAAGELPAGDVDRRSIGDVDAADLADYRQVHLFAGVGGWPLALRLAGWPDDRPVWTASCPCPPFSVAGKRQTCPECKSRLLVWCPRRTGFAICAACGHAWFADARHLWPEVWRLAAERRPQRVFGEQVESVEGVDWLAGVRGSLEILGYAVGAADLPAASVGAPHLRQRLWWVADAGSRRRGPRQRYLRAPRGQSDIGRSGPTDRLADAGHDVGATRAARRQHEPETSIGAKHGGGCASGRLADADRERRQQDAGGAPGDEAAHGGQSDDDHVAASHGAAGGLGDTYGEGSQPRCEAAKVTRHRHTAVAASERNSGAPDGFWRNTDRLLCRDGEWRPVEPGTFPLADGVPSRVGRLRAYGNAIVPQVAAAFIRASLGFRP